MQTCAGGVTLCGGTVGGRGSGSKARFTAEKSVERRAIVDLEQTGKCDTSLMAAVPWKMRMQDIF